MKCRSILRTHEYEIANYTRASGCDVVIANKKVLWLPVVTRSLEETLNNELSGQAKEKTKLKFI